MQTEEGVRQWCSEIVSVSAILGDNAEPLLSAQVCLYLLTHVAPAWILLCGRMPTNSRSYESPTKKNILYTPDSLW